ALRPSHGPDVVLEPPWAGESREASAPPAPTDPYLGRRDEPRHDAGDARSSFAAEPPGHSRDAHDLLGGASALRPAHRARRRVRAGPRLSHRALSGRRAPDWPRAS